MTTNIMGSSKVKILTLDQVVLSQEQIEEEKRKFEEQRREEERREEARYQQEQRAKEREEKKKKKEKSPIIIPNSEEYSRLDSIIISAPFDKAKQELEEQGYRIISLAENARLRMQEGLDSDVCKNGNYTREAAVYIPKKGIFLTKKSPIMLNAREATQCHRDNREFYLTKSQVEDALSDSIELNSNPIPTNRFGEDERTRFAFGEYAQKYGEFLEEAGIKEMPIWLTNILDKPFAIQMWLCRLGGGGRSGLVGSNWVLDYCGRALGVRSQKNSRGKK